MTTAAADETLDCVGLYCPMPVVQTAQKLKGMALGQVLEIIADDPGAKSDIPAWCQATGNEFLGLAEDGKELKLYVRKAG
jgi:tRNA 2-thiouridine synthesizing protein A